MSLTSINLETETLSLSFTWPAWSWGILRYTTVKSRKGRSLQPTPPPQEGPLPGSAWAAVDLCSLLRWCRGVWWLHGIVQKRSRSIRVAGKGLEDGSLLFWSHWLKLAGSVGRGTWITGGITEPWDSPKDNGYPTQLITRCHEDNCKNLSKRFFFKGINKKKRKGDIILCSWIWKPIL